jgi:ketosteroid isomerase-like protein
VQLRLTGGAVTTLDEEVVMSDQNVRVIQSIYAAFAKGDVAAVLSHVADATRWDFDVSAESPVPWHTPVTSKGDVPTFLAAFVENVQLAAFEPTYFIHSGDDVVAHIRIAYTVRRTGKKVDMDQLHWWTLLERKVVRLRHFEDTAAVMDAYRR